MFDPFKDFAEPMKTKTITNRQIIEGWELDPHIAAPSRIQLEAIRRKHYLLSIMHTIIAGCLGVVLIDGVGFDDVSIWRPLLAIGIAINLAIAYRGLPAASMLRAISDEQRTRLIHLAAANGVAARYIHEVEEMGRPLVSMERSMLEEFCRLPSSRPAAD